MAFIRRAMIIVILYLIATTAVFAEVLTVPQVFQQQTQWCWAASSEMVLDYYGIQLTQEEIADYGTEGANIWNWLWGETSNPTRRGIDLILYQFGGIHSASYGRPLSLAETTTHIEDRRPSIVRWGWNSGGGHFIVCHGVELRNLHGRDPWYGSFIADYDWVIAGGTHTWTHTLEITSTHEQDDDPPEQSEYPPMVPIISFILF